MTRIEESSAEKLIQYLRDCSCIEPDEAKAILSHIDHLTTQLAATEAKLREAEDDLKQMRDTLLQVSISKSMSIGFFFHKEDVPTHPQTTAEGA